MLARISMIAAAGLMMVSCERETRTFRPASPALNSPAESIQVSQLRPGSEPGPPVRLPEQYQETAEAVASGQKLFSYYNCSGCHGLLGGGSIGPALMDNNWLYGSEPQNIYSSIIDGRPNGMPSWRGRIPDYQVWELVAYVRAVGGLTSPEIAVHPQPDIIPIERGNKPGEVTGTTGQAGRR
jgi:cytochrome c oxidase cbb3-type subunit 3